MNYKDNEHLNATAAALLDPTLRLNRSGRERIMRLRDRLFTSMQPEVDIIVPTAATPEPLKLARKLAKLPLVRVLRRQRKFAREASTAKHLLAKMSGFSRIRTHVAAAQDTALAALGQATAELKARALACEGRLA